MVRRAKAPRDPRGGHIRLYYDIVDSPAWRVLSHADVRIYLAMRRKLGATNNGDINAILAELKHAGINSSSTLATALHRLEALGFIEKTRQGGIANGGKQCSLYRFCDVETFDIAKAGVKAGPATGEWKKFKTLAEARAAVAGFAKAKDTSKLRLSNRSASTIEAETTPSASTFEQVRNPPVRSSKRRKPSEIALERA